MALLEVGAASALVGGLLGGLATLAKVRYEGGNKRLEIDAQRDEQEAQQAERVVTILRELLAEERSRADRLQQQSERLSDELAANKQMLYETQAEVRLLRRDMAEQAVQLNRLQELLEEHKIPYLRAVRDKKKEKP